jgi:drug/metabolite transporter (DMT)-like permease
LTRTAPAGAPAAARLRTLLAVGAANLLFAGSFPTSAIALRGFRPLTLTGLRFAGAALLLAPVALPALRRLSRADRGRLVLLAGFGLWLQMALIYFGIDASQAAIAAVIVGLEPVLIALWAALLLSERFTGRRAGGLVIGLAGSVLVAGVGSGGSDPVGLLCLLGTGLTFSWYTVSSKRMLGRLSAAELVAAVSVVGALVAVGPAVAEVVAADGWRSPGGEQWLCLAYLAFGNSVLGYVLWNRALHGLPAAAVGASLYAQPVLGAGVSWLALREPLPATFLPGTALVLLGVWVATGRRGTPAAPV